MGRPVGKNLSQAEKEAIISLYRDRRTTTEIASLVGVSKSTVTRLTHREGLRPKQMQSAKRLTDLDIQNIQTLYTETLLPKTHIAKRLGVSVDSVNHHTTGLERDIPQRVIECKVAQYLQGETTADQVKAEIGINKHDFYKEVAEELEKNG